MSFKRLRSEKFSQEVANQIKKSIFDRTYETGDKLPSESDMAGMFGVSNVTVRQAIRVLENSGILYTKQGVDGGIFVAEADASAVSSYLSDMLKLKRVTQSDLTMSRLIFEPDIASQVAQVWRDDDLEEAYLNIKQARIAFKKNDLSNTRLLNLGFHRLICSITRNPVIIFTLNSVIDVLEENVLNINLGEEFVLNEIEEHEIIIEKIKQRQIKASRDQMRRHIQKVQEKLETAYASLTREDV